MKTWLIRGLILVAVIAVVLLLRATVLAPDPVPVRTVAADTGQVEETVTNSRAGTVKARRRAKLSPDTGGQVVEIPFREGDRVEAGAVVLRLESESQQARLELARQDEAAARAERERACLAAERAKRELERFRRLAEDQIVSTDLLDAAETTQLESEAACRAAAAQVARAAAAISVARTELGKRLLRTPFTGIVAEVSTELGEWVTPSPPALPVPPVIDVLDPTSIYISAPMDEVDSARIRVGQQARVTVDSHQGSSFAGRIVRVAPYVLDLEAQNRTVDIDVELDDASLADEMLPGTSADVEIILSVRNDVLRIPTSTLIEGQKVLVLADGFLVERQVATGLRNWDSTEILSGLTVGDRVVTSLDRSEVAAGAEAVEQEDEDA
jgi:HlyD family secretion protein